MDPRDRYLSSVVSGKTFAEVGGLWGTVNERVTVAHAAGARELTMIDIHPAGGPLWTAFEARRRAEGVPSVRHVSGDVMQLAPVDATLRFDVVHCSGILYHVPDLFTFLTALRTITREHLILTTSITETHIANEAGELHIPDGSALFLPALSPSEKAVLKAHWWPTLGDMSLGLTRDIAEWKLTDFGPWWWLPTTPALLRMCEIAGFEVRAHEHLWNGHAATVLLRTR